MAWQNVIIGYKIKRFEITDIIPIGALFLQRESGKAYICGGHYSYDYFIYQVPVYKKKNIKTTKP